MAINTISIEKSLIDKNLYDFVNNEIIPGTNIDPNTFWKEFIQSANHQAVVRTCSTLCPEGGATGRQTMYRSCSRGVAGAAAGGQQ